nr:MAG TPA: hypothetical protein [Caudoviricetes sp.]
MIFYCDRARDSRCCVDCQQRGKCRNPCTNDPSRRGQEDTRPRPSRRGGRKKNEGG